MPRPDWHWIYIRKPLSWQRNGWQTDWWQCFRRCRTATSASSQANLIANRNPHWDVLVKDEDGNTVWRQDGFITKPIANVDALFKNNPPTGDDDHAV